MKRAAAVLACLAIAVTVGAGDSSALVNDATLTLSESSAYENVTVDGTGLSTLHYWPGGPGASFTVTVPDAATGFFITSVTFPDVFGTDGGTVTTSPFSWMYTWPSGASASGQFAVGIVDANLGGIAHFNVAPDAASPNGPAVTDTTPSELTGAADQYWDPITDTLWFRPAATGSFTLNATATDAVSGIANVAFPDVSAVSGWTGSTGGQDAFSPYSSPVAYAWTANATAPGAQLVTATSNSSLTATDTITLSADSTAPTGQTVALSGGPLYTTASVPLTINWGTDASAGLDAASEIVQRDSATLSGGICGSFSGTWSTVTLAGSADTTVATGNCYRYRLAVSDRVGNQTTSSATADAQVSTIGPTVTDTAPTELTGATDEYWDSTTDTLWIRPAAPTGGSFTLNATAADTVAGIAQVAFPDVSATSGWAGSTGGVDTVSPYSSPVAYTWTTGALAPGAKQVTATSNAALTASDTITLSVDSIAPTGQTVALSGVPPWYTTPSIPLKIGAGSDTASGVDATRGLLERASATLANGVCGTTFSAYSAVTPSGGSDTSVASGHCYHYRYTATDNVGNVSTVSATSADAKVDFTPPTAPTFLFSGLKNTSATGTTIYYRSTGSGSFTVTAGSMDGDSAIGSYTFPAVPGFTLLGSGASRTYSFTAAPSAPSAPVTVTATNGAGLTSTAGSFTLVADRTPPTVTVRCNSKPCLSTTYQNAVTITLSATDTGSDVGTIRYTTDGGDPTLDGGAEYFKPLTVNTLTHLKVRAYDQTGNPSATVAVTVRSVGDRLILSAPARVNIKSAARYLKARLSISSRAIVTAAMTGPGLKTPQRWHFMLTRGASIVQLRLPTAMKYSGRYSIVWNAHAGTRKASKRTAVVRG